MSAAQDARRIASICVVGGGIVGLSAAIAFARSLPQVAVTLVATPPNPAALADRLPGTLPAVRSFHALLGIDERELVAQGIATHRIGTRFNNWPGSSGSWIHATGGYGLDGDGIPFHQLWARAQMAGSAQPFDHYSMAARLADAGKFVHPAQDATLPLGSFEYALRLDPVRYHELLAGMLGPMRITRREGRLRGVERAADGGVTAIALSNGDRITADLYLDCAGPGSALAGALPADFEDWGDWLPAMHLQFGSAPLQTPSSCDTFAASPGGWQLTAPLADTALTVTAQSPEAAGMGEGTAVQPGRRREPWFRNVLVIGDGAIAIDPVGQLNLHLAQTAITRALALLPGRDCHPLELGEYNRRTEQQAHRIRDFAVLHYLPWHHDKAIPVELPDSLALMLDQFRSRGRLPYFEGETFDRHGWLATLFGLGIVPQHPEPTSLAVDQSAAQAGMARLSETLSTLADGAPSYPEYLERMKHAAV